MLNHYTFFTKYEKYFPFTYVADKEIADIDDYKPPFG